MILRQKYTFEINVKQNKIDTIKYLNHLLIGTI